MTKLKIADNEYFSLPRLSFSSLKHILDSPAKYLHQKQVPFTGNEYTKLGTAVHLWLQGEKSKIHFEPDLSGLKTKDGNIAKVPGMTTEGKAILTEFRKNLPADSVSIPSSGMETLQGIEGNFLANPHIKKLISKVTGVENAYLEEIQGVKFKGKLDFETEDAIVDLKTSGKSANKWAFKRTVNDSHYDLQAAIYLTMKSKAQKVPVESLDYYIIALETFAPYEVIPYKLSKDTINIGFLKLNDAIKKYKEFIEGTKQFYYDIEEF